LYDETQSNPLAEARTRENNMIQWFRLPANDMGWGEVCGPFFSVLDGIILIGDDRKPYLGIMAKTDQIRRVSQGLDHRRATYCAGNFGGVNSSPTVARHT
jgi:hypothetical protein